MAQQRTLARPVEYEGVGVHSGERVRARLCPARADEGLRFVRVDLDDAPEIPVSVDNVVAESLLRQTTLAAPGRPEARVATVEHILATLAGMGVDNCRVEIDGPEAPLRDGSAAELAEAVAEAGVVEVDAERAVARLENAVAFQDGDVEMSAMPSEHLRLTFILDYPDTMIGQQTLSLVVTPKVFQNEIAPARTFCLRHEIEFLRSKGLIKGGSLDMALVVDGDELMNEDKTLRFEDEFVRHKILDLLGDLTLLGRPLRAHVIAVKSGHASHAKFVGILREAVS